jgi:hypothetical protein
MCTPGHYCPVGSPDQIPCAPGTYMTTTQASECLQCPAGSYCVDGINTPNCPAGNYCPAGTGVVLPECPIGTFGGSESLDEETDCTPCTGGKYCSTTGLDAPEGPCDVGFFCTERSPSNRPVAGATFGPCPIGHSCLSDTTNPAQCTDGTYADEEGLSACKECPAGYACELGDANFTDGECIAGHYCEEGTAIGEETPCPAGTYRGTTGGMDVASSARATQASSAGPLGCPNRPPTVLLGGSASRGPRRRSPRFLRRVGSAQSGTSARLAPRLRHRARGATTAAPLACPAAR